MNPDKPTRYDSECFREISDTMHDANILAITISEYANSGMPDGEIYERFYDDVYDIDELLSSTDDEVTYFISGYGFLPIIEDDRGTPTTGFVYSENVIGKFTGLELINADDYEHTNYNNSTDLDPSDIEIICDNNDESTSYGSLSIAESGLRLYMELLLDRNVDGEDSIGGISIRSTDTRFYGIMDINRSYVKHIELADQSVQVETEDIIPTMLQASKYIQRMKRDTKFRRSSRANQLKKLDSYISTLNDRLGLARVSMMINTDRLYIPSSREGKSTILRAKLDNTNSHAFVIPIRIDSLDIFGLTSGRRIKSDNEVRDIKAGLCLVCEVEAFRLPNGELDSGIVWVPLADRDIEDFSVLPPNKVSSLDSF